MRRAVPRLLACLLAFAMATSVAALKKPVDAENLFNPLLGVEYSHWLVGPIFQIASDKEVEEYLGLISDEDAARFIEQFWEHHNKDTELFKKSPEQLFEQRAEKADSRYSEGTLPGRLTDRGTIYVLFGEPEDIEYQSSELLDGPSIEIWQYGKEAGKGLNGEKPKKAFRFHQVGDSTVFFTNSASEREARRRGRGKIRYNQ
ncbi:MAG: GWxTD domain-containing protein [Acidobacteriota bacterium]